MQPTKLQEEQPKPMSSGSPAPLLFATWVTKCKAHKSTFPLSPALPLLHKFKSHSFHQAAILLWWKKILPFTPTGPILLNDKQLRHCTWTLSVCMQHPSSALSLLKRAGKQKQYEKEKELISGATVPVCSQVWHLCTDSLRPTCLV